MTNPRFVWLLRHGQTQWNRSRRYLSHTDAPLTGFGEAQARAAQTFFSRRKIDVIVHSGLARTRETGLIVRGDRKIDLAADVRWREASHGAWEGLTYREVLARMPDDARQRFADPIHGAPKNGESLAALSARVRAAYMALGERFAGKRVLVVTHAGAIQALLCSLLGTPLHEYWRWRIDLGSVSGFDVYPSTVILRTLNTVPAFHEARRVD
jgi:2,3-bisphosphoglycerate-dependent phosphoglycerate mutase/probable phosphoglycerate mutase